MKSSSFEQAIQAQFAIDETHFPDKVFREQIIAEFDKDGDSVLSVDEISKAQFLNLHGMKTISSLEGIQYLTTKPSGQKNPVKTGDMTNVGLFTSMFAGSTGVLAVLFGKKRKRNKNN